MVAGDEPWPDDWGLTGRQIRKLNGLRRSRPAWARAIRLLGRPDSDGAQRFAFLPAFKPDAYAQDIQAGDAGLIHADGRIRPF